jgi:hemerythrin superfamily protein
MVMTPASRAGRVNAGPPGGNRPSAEIASGRQRKNQRLSVFPRKPSLAQAVDKEAGARLGAAPSCATSKEQPMDLYQLIKQDHQKVKRLFERLAEADSGSPSQTRIFAELKRELELHTTVEEKYFYPALQQFAQARDLVEEALAEHADVKATLEELDQGDKEDDAWMEEVSELQQDIEHHVEEEENAIFPLAAELLDAAQVEAIARDIQKEKAAAQGTA